ncbi:MAG: acyl-CoA thioesterase, partial [Polyangiaceae bacterium]
MSPAKTDVLTPRPSSASITEMTEYVLPQHANLYLTVFGGQIMAWVDLCAAVCAQRHSGRLCVTASVDGLLFKQPVRVGQVVQLRAHVTATFRTSMEIAVSVTGEDTLTG